MPNPRANRSKRQTNRILHKQVNAAMLEIKQSAASRNNICVATEPHKNKPLKISTPHHDDDIVCIEVPTEDAGRNELVSNIDSFDESSLDDNAFEDIMEVNETEFSVNDSINEMQTLDEKLRVWSTEENVPHSTFRKLLEILKSENDINAFKNLPRDPRTLLNTPRKVLVKTLDNGSFYYFGISDTLNNLLLQLKYTIPVNTPLIEIIVNIDGLPLTSSSNSSLWPILIKIDSLLHIKNYVVMVAVFHGYSKPSSANEFLKDFIDEAVNLSNKGIFLSGNNYPFRIKMLVCDAPAKSYVLNVKGHTAETGCTKCYQTAERINNVMCFPWTAKRNLRSDYEFRNCSQDNHHQGTTLFTSLPKFDLIKDVPLDYMHLVCLGVMKRLLCHKNFGWIQGTFLHKLSATQQGEISKNLKDCNNFIVCEFSNRKARSLQHCARFKAVEFRLLLLYTGPVVFKKFLKPDYYYNFLNLYIAMRILNSEDYGTSTDMLVYAKALLDAFVKDSGRIYGPDFISFNVHNLLHLVDDAERFGPVHNFSAFDFENYMQILKKLVRKQDKLIQQIVKRVSERISCKIDRPQFFMEYPQFLNEHSKGPLLRHCCSPQFMIAKLKGYTFKLNLRDCYALLNDKNLIKICNFVTLGNAICAIGQSFTKIRPWFNRPCSSELVGVWCININHFSNLKMYNISDIRCKVMILPYNDNEYIATALLHL
ncbi:hypothetical protein PPYR_02085 [Photinus pyralis]|uniref:Uncharacterized protein n=1 Tax=Photinus pyralis TaxID=7054 RepID=A0A5N4B691_PHOPY|nr:hypothetical protein PPYR_02085 [Photinus pyralis]